MDFLFGYLHAHLASVDGFALHSVQNLLYICLWYFDITKFIININLTNGTARNVGF